MADIAIDDSDIAAGANPDVKVIPQMTDEQIGEQLLNSDPNNAAQAYDDTKINNENISALIENGIIDSSIHSKNRDMPKDSSWVSNSFLLPDLAFEDIYYRQNRFATTAAMKFGDTRPGSAIGINSRPQFTPYADIRVKGRDFRQEALKVDSPQQSQFGYGYGRYWSENYDDPQQKIYMRFGVPEFNPISNFIRRAFTYEEIVIARRGRTPSWLYDIGGVVGTAVWLTQFPLLSMAFLFFKGVNFLLSKPANKYYSFKTAMHYYWSMVQVMVNTIMVNRGVMPRALKQFTPGDLTQQVGRPYQVNSDLLDYFSELFPEFFSTNKINDTQVSKYFDVFSIATKAQRNANNLFKAEYAYLEAQNGVADASTFKGYVNRREDFVSTYITGANNEGEPTILNTIRKRLKFSNMFSSGETQDSTKLVNSSEIDPRVKSSQFNVEINLNNDASIATGGATEITQKMSDAAKTAAGTDTQDTVIKEKIDQALQRSENVIASMGSKTTNNSKNKVSALDDANYLEGQYTEDEIQKSGFFKDFFENLDAEFNDGSGFAVFCVDYTGSISESFSNSYGESDLSNKLNSLSASAKELRYTVGEGSILGSTMQTIINSVGDLAFGVAEKVTLGMSNLLLGLAGSGFIDIPKHWQDSSCNLPRSNYTMTLISPYNNVFSHLINIYIPMAMLLCGAVPRSVGRSSYVGPFICQLFDRGRNQIQLGAITSLSFTRATSNLGYSLDGKALAIECSFEVTDLSSIMHMPMGSGSFLDGASTLGLDDDSVAANYLAVLAGQDMYSQVYAIPRAITRLAKVSASLGKVGSGYYWSSFMHEKLSNGGGLFLLTRPVARFYEMINVGTNVINGANSGN